MRFPTVLFALVCCSIRLPAAGTPTPTDTADAPLRLTLDEYREKAEAIWLAQMIAVQLGWPFEHKQRSAVWVDQYTPNIIKDLEANHAAPLDDDWYYEMAALRAFEKHGVGLTVRQLGEQWVENNVGTWGSSGQARLNLIKGIAAPDSGHPRYNRLWFTMGNQCRGELFGMLAPGMPNVAARLSRELGHVNSYAEGTDGGVLVSTMISLAFVERDPQTIVRRAAQVLDPATPHRQCLELLIRMAEAGKGAQEIADAIENTWHAVYPATNNAVSNGGLAATALWFGKGDFLTSVNLAYSLADFTDADCNGAVAASVVAAMHGRKALPAHLVAPLQNRIKGTMLGHVKVTPAVDMSITDLAAQTVTIGTAILRQAGARLTGSTLEIATQTRVETQPAELFAVADFMRYWNTDWQLENAGHGAPGGGHRGIRGGTFVDGDVLATYPRDEVRGAYLHRTLQLGSEPTLRLEVAADPGRIWRLEVFVDNTRVLQQLVDGGPSLEWPNMGPEGFPSPDDDYERCSKLRHWQPLKINLAAYANKRVTLRLYQGVLIRNRAPGNAYWRAIAVP